MNLTIASFWTNTLKRKLGSPKYTNAVMADNSKIAGV
jgi:hypothetical protein